MTTDMPVSYALHETQLALDRPVNVFLGHDETLPENPDSLARTFLGETTSYWQDWVRDLNVPFDWQTAVIRAAITLKLCVFEDTGAARYIRHSSRAGNGAESVGDISGIASCQSVGEKRGLIRWIGEVIGRIEREGSGGGCHMVGSSRNVNEGC